MVPVARSKNRRSGSSPSDPEWERPKELSLCWSTSWVLWPVFFAGIFPPRNLPLVCLLLLTIALSMFYWYNKTSLRRTCPALAAAVQICDRLFASTVIGVLTYDLATLSPTHALAAALLFAMVFAFFVRSCVEMGMLPPMSDVLMTNFCSSCCSRPEAEAFPALHEKTKAKKRPRPTHFLGFVDHTLFRASAWALAVISTVAPRLPHLLSHPLYWPCFVAGTMFAYSLTLVVFLRVSGLIILHGLMDSSKNLKSVLS